MKDEIALGFMGKTRPVADKISEILKKGIRLDGRNIHFIESTFCLFEPEEVKKALEDDERCENEVLVPLIFFPDETQQLQLEPVLKTIHLEPLDIPDIFNRVKNTVPCIGVEWPDALGGFTTELSEAALEHFIPRLHLAKPLDKGLTEAMDRFLPEDANLAARVKLRNSRIDFSDRNVIWLEAFLGAYGLLEDSFDTLFVFALEFLEDATNEQDLYPALMGLKKRCFSAIEKNKAFEANLLQFNMETLMFQGKRASGVHTDTARKKMQMIDRISFALYGRTEYLEPRVIQQDPGEIPAESIFENLSRMGR
ncbi:MAG: hypothetical protein FP816_00855 [Desulfobacteraceae bacterium]|nr:hypothetical protein [Desulfobacteraceae bacterium]